MSEIEKQFMKAFGIEPRIMTEPHYFLNSEYYEVAVKNYPQITDRILLELISLQPLSIEFKYLRSIEEFKNTLLGYYIEELNLFAEPSEAEIFKQKVQALFKENN